MSKADQGGSLQDTGRQHLGSVYAKALLGVTQASGKTAQVLEEFDSLLSDVFAKLPQFEATLASPRVSHDDKVRMLDQAFGNRMSVDLLNFLKVVSRHGRLDCLRAINQAAHTLYDTLCGRITVQVRAAETLDDATVASVRARLEQLLKRQVILQTKVDPSLIAGLVIRVGDTVFDGSLATRLERMRSGAVEQTMQTLRQSVDRYVAG